MDGCTPSRPPKHRRRRPCVIAQIFPTVSSGICRIFSPTGTGGRRATTSSTRKSLRLRRCRAPSRVGRRICWRRSGSGTTSVSSSTKSGTSPRSGTTRISATTRSTRSGSRCRFCSPRPRRRRAWFDPELLKIPLATVQAWMAKNHELAVYRFAIEDLYRQQEHVLDDKGEHLLSLASRFETTPNDAYAALSTADAQFPDGPPVERRRGDADLRPVSRDPRDEPQPAGPRDGVRGLSTSCTKRTPTRTRRSTTACCSATGSSRRRAATGRRSTWRCTATTSRPPSSRT